MGAGDSTKSPPRKIRPGGFTMPLRNRLAMKMSFPHYKFASAYYEVSRSKCIVNACDLSQYKIQWKYCRGYISVALSPTALAVLNRTRPWTCRSCHCQSSRCLRCTYADVGRLQSTPGIVEHLKYSKIGYTICTISTTVPLQTIRC